MTDKYHIPAGTKIGSVELAVNDLELMTDFYTSLLGLNLIKQNNKSYSLGASGIDKELLILNERKDLKAPAANAPGLFHFALFVPSRNELAKILINLYRRNVNFDGFANHGVSEAIYLKDPEGNGIEIYSDTQSESWIWNGDKIQMVTEPLNIDSLLSIITSNEKLDGFPPETRIGHIHLKVSSIDKAKKFYNESAGFKITQSDYPGALFFAAGNYHHHIGANTWISKNAPACDTDTLGLQKFSVVLPDLLSLKEISFRLLKDGRPVISQTDSSFITSDLDGIKIEFKTNPL
ncbi:MAG: VOC family protein [Ignavibacteriales bacterium]|nr:MAG: VOC family protein [Ignavibacteriales bacterium]